jgi:UDP-2,4-diacetamido-2,4,6-trideoxy-beta-L-altropyranose hydrolase
MADQPRLLIRADANAGMGSGHVMRCLALAQAWQDSGGRAVFATAPPVLLRERLRKESFQICEIDAAPGSTEDALQTLTLAREHGARSIAVDGYHFGANFQRTLKADGFKVLFLDDYGHSSPYSADWVLNQNASAQGSAYDKRQSYTQLLLGPRYCLLRREFMAWQEWSRDIAPVGRRVLVTMGGSDPENFTRIAIQAVSYLQDDNLEVDVVVGGANQHSYLAESVAPEGAKKIRLHRDVKHMPELMAAADVAISAAGTTAWELCFLGLPSILVSLAPNQIPIAQELSRQQCAIHLGDAHDVSAQELAEQLQALLKSKDQRRAISLRGRELVDGSGAKRVVAVLRGLSLQLRPVKESDVRLLWEWVNDSQVRAASFSSEPIPWEKHEAWFTSKLNDPDGRILIAEDEQGRAIGQFRLDWRSHDDADIDVSVCRECRGRGYGRVLIDMGVSHAHAERGAVRLHAYVKPENEASRRSFELARFENLGQERVNGHYAVHYVRTHEPDHE